MTQQNRRHPGRDVLSRIELPFQTSICFPPFESIWVRKGKRDIEGSTQESNDWNKILSYLQHFHKNSEISTRKKTDQSFPADSGFLCSPHEARDFCLRLPVCESAEPTISANRSPTLPDRRGRMKMVLTKRFQTQPVISFSVCSWVEQSLSL